MVLIDKLNSNLEKLRVGVIPLHIGHLATMAPWNQQNKHLLLM